MIIDIPFSHVSPMSDDGVIATSSHIHTTTRLIIMTIFLFYDKGI